MKTILTISCCLLLLSGFSSEKLTLSDSLINVSRGLQSDTAQIDFLIDESWNYMLKDNRITLKLLSEVNAINSNKETSYKADVVIYYYGVLNRRIGEFDKAKSYYKQYYELAVRDSAMRKMANVQLALSNLYFDNKVYDSSMYCVDKAIEIYAQTNDMPSYCKSLRKVANIMRKINRYDDALSYLDQCIAKATTHGIASEIAEAQNDKGIVFEKLNMPDSMFHYYYLYYDYAVEKNEMSSLVYANYNIAIAHFETDNFEKALHYVQLSKEAAESINDLVMLKYANILKGTVEIKNGNAQNGISILEPILENELSIEDQSDIYEALSEGYENLGNYKRALADNKKFKLLADSILNQNMLDKVNKLETDFSAKEKAREIELLNSQNSLMMLELERVASQKIYFLLGLFALSAIVFLLLRSNRLSNKHQTILREKNRIVEESLQEKKSLLQEIHHRVKNNLQIISSLLSLQSRQLKDPVALEAIKDGRNRVKSMALIHQNLYEDENLIGVDMEEYINRLAKSLLYNYKVSDIKIDLKTEVDSIKMNIDQIIPLGLILNELITNSLKYAFKEKKSGIISIKLKEINNLIVLEVFDDGKGLPEGFSIDQYNSLGFKLINSFTKKLNAKFEIATPKIGTLIKIEIPQLNAA